MLPNEIEPFADQHIKALEEVVDVLKESQLRLEDPEQIEGLEMIIFRLNNARAAFTRFKVCMADEVRQKNLYRDRWMEIRFKD